MNVTVCTDKYSLARAAAESAADAIRLAVQRRGVARITAATGASQFEFLGELTATKNIEWQRVEMFHLDEYLGIADTHPASFRRYLLDRLIIPAGITRYHLLDGEADPRKMISDVTEAIRTAPIDVAFVGIGENGHLAFNDPPADFRTQEAYMVVELDEDCRRQQVAEGWFERLEDVPRRAISMTIQEILRAQEIICVVPEARKAKAVARCFQGEISPLAPASALRCHKNAWVYLDKGSAALLPLAVGASIEL
jgi:glucosamine-6-phosphate deaminase